MSSYLASGAVGGEECGSPNRFSFGRGMEKVGLISMKGGLGGLMLGMDVLIKSDILRRNR